MANVTVHKVNGSAKRLPVFDEIEKTLDQVRQRAFTLFEKRGCGLGRGLDDWLQAEREILGSHAAELVDKDNAYEMQVALPGFDPKDVRVTATPTEVIVHAESNKEIKSQVGKVLWTEFASNNVCRQFKIPNPIDADKTTARLEKGLLRITAPKTVQSQGKPTAAKAVA
jgi:HSP20 family protein